MADVPREKRQQHCLMPGRGPLRCGSQPTTKAWYRMEELSEEEANARNARIRRLLQYARENPYRSNDAFLMACRRSSQDAANADLD